MGYEKLCINRYKKLAFNFFIVYVIAVLTSFLRTKSVMEIYGAREDGKEILYAVFDTLGVASYFSTPSLNETWWYMSLAIILVFVVPLFVLFYKKIGKVLIIVAIFTTTFDIDDSILLSGYFMPVAMGIVFAEEGYFEKIYNLKIVANSKSNSVIKLVIIGFCFLLLMFKRDSYIDYRYWIDTCAPILLGAMVLELSNLLPCLEGPMNYIGKHSMNIFLIHTLIFEYYFIDFIYGFKYWMFVLLALLITSLVGSIIIEWIKKILRINVLIDKCLSYK